MKKKIETGSQLFLISLFLIVIVAFGYKKNPLLGSLLRTMKTPTEVPAMIETFEKDFNELFFLKNEFIDLNGLFCERMGQSCVNSVYKLDNGYMTEMMGRVEDSVLEERADAMAKLGLFVRERGGDFLYVQAPYKVDKYDSHLPPGVEDYSNQNADRFLGFLRGHQVEQLDIRTELRQSGLSTYDVFFKTDHHWKPEGGFFAFQAICDYIERHYGYKIDPQVRNKENYQTDIYRNWSLGSWGKRTGKYFGGLDDISLIYPQFLTDMSFQIVDQQIEKKGSFQDVNFDYTKLFDDVNDRTKKPKDDYAMDCYYTYTGSNYGLAIHENHYAKCNKKILLIKESFALPVETFLSTAVTQIHVLDMRYYKDGTVEEYIENTSPDLVLFMLNPNSLQREVYFSYGLKNDL